MKAKKKNQDHGSCKQGMGALPWWRRLRRLRLLVLLPLPKEGDGSGVRRAALVSPGRPRYPRR